MFFSDGSVRLWLRCLVMTQRAPMHDGNGVCSDGPSCDCHLVGIIKITTRAAREMSPLAIINMIRSPPVFSSRYM